MANNQSFIQKKSIDYALTYTSIINSSVVFGLDKHSKSDYIAFFGTRNGIEVKLADIKTIKYAYLFVKNKKTDEYLKISKFKLSVLSDKGIIILEAPGNGLTGAMMSSISGINKNETVLISDIYIKLNEGKTQLHPYHYTFKIDN